MAEKLNILIVEDDSDDQQMLETALAQIELYQFAVSRVETLEGMKTLASSHQFDLIFLDLELPDSQGLETYQAMLNTNAHIPVVVITDLDNHQIAQNAIELGAQDYFVKGKFDVNCLANAIRHAITHHRIQEDLRESRRQIDSLIQNLPGMVYRCKNDDDWTMEFLSRGCTDLTGYSCHDLLQNQKISYSEIIHPDDRQFVNKRIQARVKADKPFRLEYRIITADGKVRWVLEQGNAFKHPESMEQQLEGFIIDVTDAHHHSFEQKVLYDISSLLNQNLAIEDLGNKIFQRLEYYFNLSCALLGTTTQQPGVAKIIAAMCEWASANDPLIDISDCIIRKVITKGKSFIVSRKDHPEDFCNHVECTRSDHIAVVPLKSHHKIFGFLLSGRNLPFSDYDTQLLELIADQVSAAIEVANLHRKTQLQVKRLESLHTIDLAITGVFNINVINRLILDEIRKCLGVDAVAILMLNRVTNMLEQTAEIGLKNNQEISTKLAITNTTAGQVFLNRSPCYIKDVNLDADELISMILKKSGFASYFAVPLLIKGESQGVLEVFMSKPYYPDVDWLQFMESLATQIAIAYDSYRAFTNVQKMQRRLERSYDNTLESWSNSLAMLEPGYQENIQWVKDFSASLAEKLGLTPIEISNMERGVLLHDIGKVGVLNDILNKKGSLTAEEWTEVKKHPEIAQQLISNVDVLKDAVAIPYCHHENWDGSGYPRGLKGNAIPIEARIFAVVETFDALTSERPYRSPWKKEDAIAYLREQSGRKFDPQIVESFLDSLRDLKD